ncbi:MAG: ERF family protein [Rhizobiaceae bacterium]|nr:ERF family protein [Rhizobiaceae bacterium]
MAEKAEKQAEATKLPATLPDAVVAVMAAVTRLKKADRNKFANYDFTSVDDFKDSLRPLLAKHGLYVVPNQVGFQFVEVKSDKDKTSTLAQFDFDITLKHVSGEVESPERMTVFLPLTGAQTSGAARSYVIKEWLKGRFLASSGDTQEEADLLDQSREGLRLSKAEARGTFEKMQKGLRDAAKGRDHDALSDWWLANKEVIETLPKDWFLTLKNEYAETYRDLKAQAQLDGMSNANLDQQAIDEELRHHPLNGG